MKRTERSILLDAAAVRAILAGRKTQIRWIVKPQPNAGPNGKMVDLGGASWGLLDGVLSGHWRCPFGEPGDRLWGKETWRYSIAGGFVVYRADPGREESTEQLDAVDKQFGGTGFRWRAPVSMRRDQSRLTLEVEGIRVQRVQDISEEDADAEGVERHRHDVKWPSGDPGTCGDVCRRAFSTYWDTKYGPGSFDRNDWVWAATFRHLVEPEERK